jgi:hypothetical protein
MKPGCVFKNNQRQLLFVSKVLKTNIKPLINTQQTARCGVIEINKNLSFPRAAGRPRGDGKQMGTQITEMPWDQHIT